MGRVSSPPRPIIILFLFAAGFLFFFALFLPELPLQHSELRREGSKGLVGLCWLCQSMGYLPTTYTHPPYLPLPPTYLPIDPPTPKKGGEKEGWSQKEGTPQNPLMQGCEIGAGAADAKRKAAKARAAEGRGGGERNLKRRPVVAEDPVNIPSVCSPETFAPSAVLFVGRPRLVPLQATSTINYKKLAKAKAMAKMKEANDMKATPGPVIIDFKKFAKAKAQAKTKTRWAHPARSLWTPKELKLKRREKQPMTEAERGDRKGRSRRTRECGQRLLHARVSVWNPPLRQKMSRERQLKQLKQRSSKRLQRHWPRRRQPARRDWGLHIAVPESEGQNRLQKSQRSKDQCRSKGEGEGCEATRRKGCEATRQGGSTDERSRGEENGKEGTFLLSLSLWTGCLLLESRRSVVIGALSTGPRLVNPSSAESVHS